MNFEGLRDLPPVWGTVLHTLLWVAIVVWVFRRRVPEPVSRGLRGWILLLAVVQIGLYWWL